MKKIFYTLFAGVIALASCSKSDKLPTTPQTETTTFTLAVEQDPTAAVGKVSTRTTSTVAPARYIMEVWSADGTTPENVFDGWTTNRAEITDGSKEFTAVLDKAKAYTCLFWADDNSAFDASQLKSVAINADKDPSEAYYSKVSVGKGYFPAIAVTLKRAVAKVVLVETDQTQTDVELALAFTNIYPTFDVFGGEASGKAGRWDKTVKLGGQSGTLATLYFFAKTEPQLSELTFTYADEVSRTVSNIPYQQNYATTIKGAYSSRTYFTFIVTADDTWDTPDTELDFNKELPANAMSMMIDTRNNPKNSTDNTFALPMGGKFTGFNFTVDWGDGTTNEYTDGTDLTKTNMTHTYPKPGVYTITITSTQLDPTQRQIPKINFLDNSGEDNNNKLVVLNSPLLNMGNDLSNCFNGCQNLISISENLFINNTAATTFDFCFSRCESLTSIPAGLFATNTVATNFKWCFDECTALTSIPAGLFDNNTEAKDFTYCFAGYNALTSIPAGLFDNNTAAYNFYGCFSDCESLTSIPAGLFDNNTEAKDFTYCFAGYNALTSIPAGLFDNNTAAYNFYGCFSDCESLTSIPAGLFDNNTAAYNFELCFNGCNALTSIPAGLFDNTSADDFSSCFSACTALTSIPAGLFDNTNGTEFNSCFSACTALTSIPAGLFDNNTAATNFHSCFKNCTALTSIPAGLFDNNTKVFTFESCFEDCKELTSIPELLFAKNTAATHFQGCFRNCTKLVLNSNIFCHEATQKTDRFANQGEINFRACFKSCGSELSSGAGGTAPTLWNYPKDYYLSEECFNGANNVTNARDIPNDWR